MDVRLPDGTIVQNVPDGMSKADLAAKLRANGMNIPDDWMKPPPTVAEKVVRGVGDLAAGAVRGAGSIGATIMAPVDMAQDALAGKGFSLESNRARRQGMDNAFETMGADPDSMMYGAGKLAGEIAGTAGVGSALAGGARAAGAAAPVVEALATGGMKAGGLAGVRGAALRAGAGAAGGATAAGMVDPSQAVTGGVVGAVAPGVVKGALRAGGAAAGAAQGAYRGLRAAAEPFTASGRQAIAGRVLARAAGDDAAAAVPRLQQAAPLVPGSMPTAAQVAENGGIAALERAVAAKNPAPFADRATEQTAARIGAVEDIAGDAGQKEFFNAAREDAARELYERAFSVPVRLEELTPAMRGEVQKLLKMPAIQLGLKAARQNAADHGMKIEGAGSVAGLHQAKLALDDMISQVSGPGVTGAQANRARAIEAARDRLVSFIERVSPDYAEARATYAAMSRPINQQDVGQELLEKLQPALGEAGAVTRENGESFARALRDGDGLVKKATGRNMRFDDVMEPEQAASLRAVSEDLARKTNAADLARGPGSNTFQNFAVDNIAEQAGAPRALGALFNVPVLGKLPRMLYERPEQQIQEEVIRALLHPQTASQMMGAQIQRQAALNAPRQPLLSDPRREAIELLFARTSPVLSTGQ